MAEHVGDDDGWATQLRAAIDATALAVARDARVHGVEVREVMAPHAAWQELTAEEAVRQSSSVAVETAVVAAAAAGERRRMCSSSGSWAVPHHRRRRRTVASVAVAQNTRSNEAAGGTLQR